MNPTHVKTLAVTLCVLFVVPMIAHAGPTTTAPKKSGMADTDKEASYPAQSSVAAKSVLATVPASAAAKALAATDLTGATKLIGKSSMFHGTVSKVYVPRGNSAVILDFDPEYKDALTAVVRPADYKKFPDLSKLEGDNVLVSGKFIAYEGRPEIQMTSPSQIKILK